MEQARRSALDHYVLWTARLGAWVVVREPWYKPLEIIRKGAAHIVRVSDDEIAKAIRILHIDTHNLAEGAGAAALARSPKRKAGLLASTSG